jgi:anhydro-N-acetylmuramic acid kinase
VTDWNLIARMPTRLIVGLMSGTSVDGIDAALVEVSGSGETLKLGRLLGAVTMPFTPPERERIHGLFDGHVADVCEMNVLLGHKLADAALAAISQAGIEPDDVSLIGSHGQTIYHIPRGSDARASSLQIGDPSVIAERTGIATVADFRLRDIAAGGEGAPLVPYVDWALCRQDGRTIALQNIGGIANVTVVTPELGGVFAFDTGPGNMVIDAAAALATDGELTFDRDGELARGVAPDGDVVRELMADRYLARNPPKSTGREYWGVDYVRGLADRGGDPRRLVATMTEFVARSIHDAYERHVFPRGPIAGVYLSGGGRRNPVLYERLVDLFAPMEVGDSGVLGLDVDFKEAIAFAVLANETVCGVPSNVPSATGADGPRVLGVLAPGRGSV